MRTLHDGGKLADRRYPEGLVEAAYAMSGGNFGWFNVIMAVVDERLRYLASQAKGGTTGQAARALTLGELFEEVIHVSDRIRQHVLDRAAIEHLKLERSFLPATRELLYGQLPVPLARLEPDARASLLVATNEYDERVGQLFRRVEWDTLACADALRAARFTRDNEVWRLRGVDQELDLKQMLANLGTYAIHETHGAASSDGRQVLLVPLRSSDFVQLVGLLYPHPAAEDAARALWKALIGPQDLQEEQATHLGPSIAMLGRLNLRYRKQAQTGLIFRDPDQSTAHEKVMGQRKQQREDARAQDLLTGVMRLIDRNWSYDPVSAGLKGDHIAIVTASGGGKASSGGLVACEALRLHPKGRLMLAWVRNVEELRGLCDRVSMQHRDLGRTPVLAFTSSRALVDQFSNATEDSLREASSYLHLYQISAGEEFVLGQIGLPSGQQTGFKLDGQGFTTAFSNRLQTLLRPLMEALHEWRHTLDSLGRIAWPLRSSGPLKEAERTLLFTAWRRLRIESETPGSLTHLDEKSGVDVEDLKAVLRKLGITPKARSAGYGEEERALLFRPLDDNAEPVFPTFLQGVLERFLRGNTWTLETAEHEWFWGYTWEAARPAEVFQDWMGLACEIGFAFETAEGKGGKDRCYRFRERSELRNLIQEADNWLKVEYPKIVEDMESIFGEGRVRELFNPVGKKPVGTKTQTARSALKRAGEALSRLDTGEALYSDTDVAARKERLVESARLRLELLEAVQQVYVKDEYLRETLDENPRTLNFEDDRSPLWRRIRRAALYAAFVREIERHIRDRIEPLCEQMRDAVSGLQDFPLALFTLSLRKIEDILMGAMHPGEALGSTGQRQLTEPGTLGQYLRDLKIADATDKLAQLAAEVGIDLGSRRDIPLEDIEGSILSGFRSLQKTYEQALGQLHLLLGRINTIEDVVRDAPSDFAPPGELTLSALEARPKQILGEIQDIHNDDVEPLRRDYDRQAKLGNFKPLMDAARDILTGPRRHLQVLAGHVLTFENAITGYRKRLLETKDLQSIERGLNALLLAQGKPQRKTLDLPELEAAGSLKAAKGKLEERRLEWVQAGNTLLSGATVSFERWQRVVAEIDAGRDPHLEPAEAESLASRGFIRRTYRLGGT